MISRRGFLRMAGVGAAATLAGCDRSEPRRPVPSRSVPSRSTTAALPSRSTTAAPTQSSRAPSPATPTPSWTRLRARLRGDLYRPGDRGYPTARLAYNPLHDGHRPAAVGVCARPADVQACVEFAAATRTPIAARSGGHSYAGYSTPDGGLVVDVGPMSTVDVRRDGTAMIGAGARLMDVYEALARAGRCLPGGSCPTVGIAGLTLGGGIGVLARSLGLTCDRLVSARVVTADGVLRTAGATSEPDLYWALRGGGGGNFGVVTSFTFATAPAPALTVFALHFPAGSAGEVLGAWQSWVVGAPDELFANCIVSGGSPPACRVGGCFAGPPGRLGALLDRFLRSTGAAPLSRYVEQMSYLDAMRYFAGCSQLTSAQCRPGWTGWTGGGRLRREAFVASSRMLLRPMRDPQQAVDAIAGSGVDAIFDSLGGAVAARAPAATAFPHRAALASVQIYHGGDAARTVAHVRDRLGAQFGPHGYVNYIDPTMPGWANAYYAGNLARLRSVADRYDPGGVFVFAQGLS